MASEYVASGVPFLRSLNVNPYRINQDGIRYVRQAFHKDISKSRLIPGDLVIVRTGKPGTAAVIPYELGECNCSDLVIVRTNSHSDSRYLSYVINGISSNQIDSRLVGAVQQHFNVGSAKALEVPWPDQGTRCTIAAILGALDDKIDLNRRMNETLEAMARALFKSWFVDFDPVRAKMEGRQPFGMDQATADLFPDRLVESEIGLIPEGWEVTTLGSAADLNPRYKLKKGDPATFVEMKSVPTAGHRPTDWWARPFTSGSKFQNGDTLLARITPCLENGKTAFVDFLTSGEIGWGSTEFIVIRPKSPMSEFWGYCLARDTDFRAFAIQTMTGSSGRQRVQVDALTDYGLVIPSQEIADAFKTQTDVIAETIRSHDLESRTLAELRDLLLPKLLSGEIRVKEAEHMVEAVA